MKTTIAALSAENAELRNRIHELEEQVRGLELDQIVKGSLIGDLVENEAAIRELVN